MLPLNLYLVEKHSFCFPSQSCVLTSSQSPEHLFSTLRRISNQPSAQGVILEESACSLFGHLDAQDLQKLKRVFTYSDAAQLRGIMFAGRVWLNVKTDSDLGRFHAISSWARLEQLTRTQPWMLALLTDHLRLNDDPSCPIYYEGIDSLVPLIYDGIFASPENQEGSCLSTNADPTASGHLNTP